MLRQHMMIDTSTTWHVTTIQLNMNSPQHVGALLKVYYCLIQHSIGICCTVDYVPDFHSTGIFSRKTIGDSGYDGHININTGVSLGNKSSFLMNPNLTWVRLWSYPDQTLFQCTALSIVSSYQTKASYELHKFIISTL